MIVEVTTIAPVQHVIECLCLQGFSVEIGDRSEGLYRPLVRKAIPVDSGVTSEGVHEGLAKRTKVCVTNDAVNQLTVFGTSSHETPKG